MDSSGPLAGGLAQALPAGAQVLLFLPNTPGWARAFFAVLAAGLQPILVDPRQSMDDLEARLVTSRPALIVTLDIGTVLDKLLRLLPLFPQVQVRIARFAAELPFPRNLLFPLLRGGGLANVPDDPRFARIEALEAVPPDLSDAWQGPLIMPQGKVSQSDLAADIALLKAQATADDRWLLAAPLASRAGLTALFAALDAGSTLLLNPRLDPPSLEKLARQGRVTRRIE